MPGRIVVCSAACKHRPEKQRLLTGMAHRSCGIVQRNTVTALVGELRGVCCTSMQIAHVRRHVCIAGDGDDTISMPPTEGDQDELGELEEQALHVSAPVAAAFMLLDTHNPAGSAHVTWSFALTACALHPSLCSCLWCNAWAKQPCAAV